MSGRRHYLRILSALFAAAVMILGLAQPAAADYGDDDGGSGDRDGYLAEVDATMLIDGENIPGGSETVSGSVPAKCAWKYWTDDPVQFRFWTKVVQMFTFGMWGFVAPSDEVLDEAVEIWDEGETPVSWYTLNCIDGVDPAYVQSYVQNCAALFPDVCFPSPWGYFVENTEPPVVIEPEELALAASEFLEIPEPAVDRNPKVSAGQPDATLVNLPTWFWVNDPESVGGEDGELSIRASIPEANVWVEITATTPGLTLTSPAGGTTCEPVRATTAWAPGASDADGCTVSFNRASVNHPDGYPVTATAQWSATWTGAGPSGTVESGELDPITAQSTVDVPVAEAQAVVTD